MYKPSDVIRTATGSRFRMCSGQFAEEMSPASVFESKKAASISIAAASAAEINGGRAQPAISTNAANAIVLIASWPNDKLRCVATRRSPCSSSCKGSAELPRQLQRLVRRRRAHSVRRLRPHTHVPTAADAYRPANEPAVARENLPDCLSITSVSTLPVAVAVSCNTTVSSVS